MRKGWFAGIVVTATVLGIATGAVGATGVRKMLEVEYRGISMKVDGRTVKTDAEPFLVVDQGRTYVPARPLAEALNAKVGWDAGTNTVQVYTPDYVEGQTAGESTTWRFPYYGLKLKAPSDMVQQSSKNVPLSLVSSANHIYFGLVHLGDAETFAKVSPALVNEMIIKVAATQLGQGQVMGQEQITIAGLPATKFITEYTVQGQAIDVQVISILTKTDAWGCFGVVAKSDATGADLLQQIYSSITVP